jgi:HEAT repeat protein
MGKSNPLRVRIEGVIFRILPLVFFCWVAGCSPAQNASEHGRKTRPDRVAATAPHPVRVTRPQALAVQTAMAPADSPASAAVAPVDVVPGSIPAFSPEPGTLDNLSAILLTHPGAQNRRQAAIVMGIMGDTAAVPALRSALADPDYQVKLEAAVALVRLADFEAAFPILARIALRQDLDPWKLIGEQELAAAPRAELREKYLPAKALLALSHIPAAESTQVIEKCLYDHNAFVRTWSCLLLLDLGREADAIPVLIQMARDPRLDQGVRSEVLTIMAKEKKRETVESLRFLSQDQDEFIAHKAQTLLAEYGGS